MTDLVLCDFKFSNEADYKKYTNGDMGEVLEFLRLTRKASVPLWIRHVVVSGLTDNLPNIEKIAEIARGFSNLEKIELLPFKKLCIAKY